MKIDFKGILEGSWNSILVKDSIEKVAKYRMDICLNCPYNSNAAKRNAGYKTVRPDLHCIQCGCDLHLKTRCLSCACPLKKWEDYVTQEEEFQITQKLANGKSS